MKKFIFLLILVSSIINTNLYAQTHISGNFTTDTQLGPNGNPADNVYIVDDDIRVYGFDGSDYITTLTIEPGVTLKFAPSTKPYLKIGHSSEPGQIIAQGTASDRIVFTSASSSPSEGDWENINLSSYSENCILDYCDILYGGYNGGNSDCNLYISNPNGTSLTISNTNINYSSAHGIYLSDIDFSLDFNNLSIENNLKSGIYHNNSDNDFLISYVNCNINNNNEYGIFFDANRLIDIDNSEFSNNGFYPINCFPNQVGSINGNNEFQNDTKIEIKGGTITIDSYWSDFYTPFNVSYLILDDITVQGTDGNNGLTTLEIESGSKFEFDPSTHPRLKIGNDYDEPGQIIAQGNSTNRIIFTSASTNPQPGEWEGLNLTTYSQDCILDYCDILYGGYNGGNSDCNLYISNPNGTSLTISNTDINYSSAHGIYLSDTDISLDFNNLNIENNLKSGVYHNNSDNDFLVSYTNCNINNNSEYGIFFDANRNIEINNSDFLNNGISPIRAYPNQVGGILNTNTFQSNQYIEVNGGTISLDSYWNNFFSNYGTYYYILNDLKIIGTDGNDGVTTLQIEEGANLRFDPSDHPFLQVGDQGSSSDPGKLLANGVTFTSTAASPQPGDWSGIEFECDDFESIIENSIITYAGYGSSDNNANIEIRYDSYVTLLHNEILHSNQNGIYVYGEPDVNIHNNLISENLTHGVFVGNIGQDIDFTYNNIYDNDEYGVMNEDNNNWVDARNVYWGSNNGPGGVGPGSGDEVSEMVMYDPWAIGPVNIYNVEINKINVNIYPNPTSNILNVEFDYLNNNHFSLNIYNIHSQSVYTKTFESNNTQIDLTHIPKGLYILKIYDEFGKVVDIRKIIKR